MEKHLVSDVETYQKLCSKSMPEVLASTLSPVLTRRIERHLDEALIPFVKSCMVPAPKCREKAVGLRKGLAAVLEKRANS